MKKKKCGKVAIVLALISMGMTPACANGNSYGDGSGCDSVNVELKNAGRMVTYKAALIVDGETVTLSNKELSATGGNEIAVLVVNGGRLILDNCTISKTGDGVSTGGGIPPQGGDIPPQSGGIPPQGGGIPPQGGGIPPQGGGIPPQGGSIPPQGGSIPPQGGDDGFNFYGTNSAVVAVGEGSAIEMRGCRVTTDAEYANAVFSCDGAEISITEGISIHTSKGSSRGLFATCAGVISAKGAVSISTQGAHCAALATDRGGGTVIVGEEGTSDVSVLNTAGDGSPCIYSTGDIRAYNATGTAGTSQTMVIEGKNSITVNGCSFEGNSPRHGGIMLYQSFSGDAEVGVSILNIKNCTIRNNSSSAMFLVTNTHSVVNMEGCTYLDANGNAVNKEYALVTCRNCNDDSPGWGREGENGGMVELNLTKQTLQGTLLANESESVIKLSVSFDSNVSGLQVAQGKGTVEM